MCTSSLVGGPQQLLGELCAAGMQVPSCTLFWGWVLPAAADPAQMRPHGMCEMHRKCGTTVWRVALEMRRCGVAVAVAAVVAVAAAAAVAAAVAAAAAAPAAPAVASGSCSCSWQLQLQLQQGCSSGMTSNCRVIAASGEELVSQSGIASAGALRMLVRALPRCSSGMTLNYHAVATGGEELVSQDAIGTAIEMLVYLNGNN